MKLSISLLFLCIFTFTITATAQQREKRNLQGFTAIQAGSNLKVYIKQGDVESVEVESHGNLEEVLTEVTSKGTLTLNTEKKWNWWFSNDARRATIYVTYKALNSISSSGGSDIIGQGPVLGSHLKISSSGGSDINLTVKAKDLEVHASGGATVVLEGFTKYLNAHASGGSDIKASKLEAEIVKANSSGGADIYVYAMGELTAAASGGSDIYYYGNPTKVNKSTSGGADITKR
jgi:hypothetical protein